MDAQTRFAKMFKLTSENGKMWILIFVENRIGVGLRCQDLKTYIKAERLEATDTTGTLTRALVKMKKSSDLDITALNIIIENGDILKHTEKVLVGHVPNIVGHLIARLRHLRNDIVHTGEASLAVDTYNYMLDILRDIAKHFERVNGVVEDTYKQEIDHIDRQKWADQEVQDTLQLYHTYLENVLQSALFQQVLLNSSAPNHNRRVSDDELESENEALKRRIVDLTMRLNLAAEANNEALSPIRDSNAVPHPDCVYCRRAHQSCTVM